MQGPGVEKKVFNVNWFKPDRKGTTVKLSAKDESEIDWWCRHYKDGISYLTYRMMQYFEAKDAGEEVENLEKIIRACLPYYWEEVTDYETEP
jgi:hypothetical protein